MEKRCIVKMLTKLKAVVAKLISDKVDFRTANTVMNKKHYHIIMLSILTKRKKTVLNVYALSDNFKILEALYTNKELIC